MNQMENKESIVIQREIINKAISYIFEHIDEDITVDDVARHCAYSKYHLTRMFKEDTEEALYQFIKRVRLERKGFPQIMFMVYQGIFCRWLSATGNQLDDRPIFDIYRKIEEDGYMEIDICFPLV